ncbi:hypothetical protein, partial [uncultured Bilophila sp.]|uniref:hypothetical protein n=1 Tax=uncultured Bilophila sp. TaxID=529385 RepID=UPI00280BA2FB
GQRPLAPAARFLRRLCRRRKRLGNWKALAWHLIDAHPEYVECTKGCCRQVTTKGVSFSIYLKYFIICLKSYGMALSRQTVDIVFHKI